MIDHPHKIIGDAVRDAMDAALLTAPELRRKTKDRTLGRSVVSRYRSGELLPGKDRLIGILRACGRAITPEIEAYYSAQIEHSPHLGQVDPGARSRTVNAR